MNAFRDLLGFTGKAADVVLLGGAVGKTKRRNKFADLLESGQFDEAEQLAIRNNEGGFAQLAQQRSAMSAQEAAAEQKRQQAQFAYIQNSAAFLDSLAPELQKGYLDLNGPALIEQGVLDEEDLPLLYQNIGVPGGFTGLARSSIDPNQQQQNVFEGQKIAEQGRSNLATERLRGGELAVSQGNLGVSQERLALDQQTQPNALNLERTKADREVFKDTQALRKEFSNVTGDFTSIRNNLNTINSVGAQKDSAGDLALLVSFTKLLDPNSVAREGEVRLAQSAAGLLENAEVWFKRIEDGKTLLPDDVRTRYINAANQIGAQYDKAFEKRQQEFRAISEAGQIDPNLVLIGSSDPRAPNPNAQGAPQADGPTAVNPQTGERVVFRNGQWEPLQ